MSSINLMRGLPGSGKSYYLNNVIAKDPNNYIIHRDEVRAELREAYHTALYYPCKANEEYRVWTDKCAEIIVLNEANPYANFYFDQTSIGENEILKFFNSLKSKLDIAGIDISNYELNILTKICDVDTCIVRNDNRNGYDKIPEKAITSMANRMRSTRIDEDSLYKKFGVKINSRLILEAKNYLQ